MSRMREEIGQSPGVAALVLEREAGLAAKLAASLRRSPPRFAVVAGRGTSDHAAILGKYLLEWGLGLPVALAAPSIATLYRGPLRLKGALVIGISQSGASTDVVEFVRRARRAGALTVAVTNDGSSVLARTSHETFLCHAGEERSVAATKTFMGEAACLYLLASLWAGGEAGRALRRGLPRVPALLDEAIGSERDVAALMRARRSLDRCVVLGRGFAFPAALETALKLKESAGVFAEGSSAADFLHGPIAMARPGLTAVLLASGGPALRSMEEAAERLRGAGADLVALTPSRALLRRCGAGVLAPACDDLFSPFPLTLLGQLAACALAEAKGLDPDRPRGLRKVTRTW